MEICTVPGAFSVEKASEALKHSDIVFFPEGDQPVVATRCHIAEKIVLHPPMRYQNVAECSRTGILVHHFRSLLPPRETRQLLETFHVVKTLRPARAAAIAFV